VSCSGISIHLLRATGEPPIAATRPESLGGAVVLAQDVTELKKKAKCIQNSETLTAKSICNHYDPECNRRSAIRIRQKFRAYGTSCNS
jgi:hypothetical protein